MVRIVLMNLDFPRPPLKFAKTTTCLGSVCGKMWIHQLRMLKLWSCCSIGLTFKSVKPFTVTGSTYLEAENSTVLAETWVLYLIPQRNRQRTAGISTKFYKCWHELPGLGVN
jgi:hypothetical protein